jgi:hypothetical protein
MPTFLEGDNKELFADYLKVWHKKDIPHIQFNVVNSKELREAKVKPEEHSELIIRVATALTSSTCPTILKIVSLKEQNRLSASSRS